MTKVSCFRPVSGNHLPDRRFSLRSPAAPQLLLVGAAVLALRGLQSAPRYGVLWCQRSVTPSDEIAACLKTYWVKHDAFRERAVLQSLAFFPGRVHGARLVSKDSKIAGSACVGYSCVRDQEISSRHVLRRHILRGLFFAWGTIEVNTKWIVTRERRKSFLTIDF